ncbi:unnamed protein product [marine sediment metagenome]|uniref:Uncharacterized protein n=1 Tax=marine sediment metagenome TaxID=412755 RepID=X1GRA5_9ZZZZ
MKTTQIGKKVTTTAVWEQQNRSELLNLFRSEVYGFAPPKPDNLAFRVVESDPQGHGRKGYDQACGHKLSTPV